MKTYDFAIVGAGIAGSSIAYFLSKKSDSVLLIDKSDGVAKGASGAAGAFLSPLLGKANKFKDLVNESLRFSTTFYKQNFPNFIINNGVLRIPKNELDREKFLEYEKDFIYQEKENGYFFDIGSLVFSRTICEEMSKNAEKLFNYNICDIYQEDGFWIINNSIKTKNIILATGADISLVPENYIKIRPVWGQRIVLKSSTILNHNYHKECSISPTIDGKISIGATHHRFVYEKETTIEDTNALLELASDIVKLENIEVIDAIGGARSASEDYFPVVGKIIDSKATLNNFPYMIHGTKVSPQRFDRVENLYVLNGVGGRGFVLSPYLAKLLSEYIFDGVELPSEITADRFFLREVKKFSKSNI